MRSKAFIWLLVSSIVHVLSTTPAADENGDYSYLYQNPMYHGTYARSEEDIQNILAEPDEPSYLEDDLSYDYADDKAAAPSDDIVITFLMEDIPRPKLDESTEFEDRADDSSRSNSTHSTTGDPGRPKRQVQSSVFPQVNPALQQPQQQFQFLQQPLQVPLASFPQSQLQFQPSVQTQQTQQAQQLFQPQTLLNQQFQQQPLLKQQFQQSFLDPQLQESLLSQQFQQPLFAQQFQQPLQTQQFQQPQVQDQQFVASQFADRLNSVSVEQQQPTLFASGQQGSFQASPSASNTLFSGSFQNQFQFSPQTFQDRFSTVPQSQTFAQSPSFPLPQSSLFSQHTPVFQSSQTQNFPQFPQQSTFFLHNAQQRPVPSQSSQSFQAFPQPQNFFGQASFGDDAATDFSRFQFQTASSASSNAAQKQPQKQAFVQRQPGQAGKGTEFQSQSSIKNQAGETVATSSAMGSNSSAFNNTTKSSRQEGATEPLKVPRETETSTQTASNATRGTSTTPAPQTGPTFSQQPGVNFRGPADIQTGMDPSRFDPSMRFNFQDGKQQQQQQQQQMKPGETAPQGFVPSQFQNFVPQLPPSFRFVPNLPTSEQVNRDVRASGSEHGGGSSGSHGSHHVKRDMGSAYGYSQHGHVYGKPLEGKVYPMHPSENSMLSFLAGIH